MTPPSEPIGQRAEQDTLVAKEELRSADRLQLALSAGRLGDWSWDAATDEVVLGPRAAEIYGLPPGPKYSRTWMRDLLHEEDSVRSRETLTKAIAERKDYVIEYRVNHSRLGRRWVAATGVHTYGPNGDVTGAIGVVQDITERRLAEEAVRESAERLQLALTAGHLGDWSWDATTDLVTLGPRAADVFGLPQGELVTWTRMRDLLHEDDAERARVAVEQALAERKDYSVEYRVNHALLGQRWVAARGLGNYAPDGSVLGMIGVVQDIHERKTAEEALLETQSRLKMAVEAGQMGDWEWGVASGKVRWSPALEAIHGLPPGGFGGSFEDFKRDMHPEDLPKVLATIQQSIEKRSDYRVEYRIIKPDGSLSWIEARGKLFLDAQGNPERMAGICMDATPRKQAEEERKALLENERAARSDAERANAMKDEFLATLSHELRTPLNSILGWSQVLKMGVSAADLQRGLDTIERNARVQAQLIEDLLDMSRITSGKVRLEIQPVEPVSVIEAAIETVRPAAESKRIRIEKMLDSAAGPVYGDPSRLQQIIWNLLSNAIKFTPKEGKVQVILERVNSHIELSVADTGIGMKAEFIPFVFDRFRQADASTTRSFGGLGLGLAIVKHLVELHGGTVRVKSAGEGQGTTFAVNLPLTVIHRAGNASERVHPKTPRAAAATFTSSDLSGVKVLVVDDEPDARDLVKHLLSESDAEVLTAATAEDALAIIEKDRPHVLVSDIGMPNVDGYELLRRVRALGVARGGSLPAVALTAFACSEDRTRALRAGFLVHVSKPVEPAELVATVASVAGRAGGK